jgi:hypothetical protein
MDRYIGLDAHASSCKLGVVAEREALGRTPCREWFYEVLSPHGSVSENASN